MISRRSMIAMAGALGAVPALSEAAALTQRHAPKGFLWGTAISAYQSEGNNTNTDVWLLENLKPTVFKDRSGDACDSYHRYAEDIALNAALGFNSYRFGIEWARIEPSPGEFSNAELDHYRDVLMTCRAHGVKSMVTFSHFSVPLWFAERGGFEVADAADLFARYCTKVVERLGDVMDMATTFNEANIPLLLNAVPVMSPLARARPMIEAARKATGSPLFSSLTYADPALTGPALLQAHRKGYAAMKAARPELPVGVTLSIQDIQGVGEGNQAEAFAHKIYGEWVDAARTHADFVGVQPYTRLLIGPNGFMPWPKGAEMTAAGYEFYPAAVGNVIRWTHKAIGKPIYVTENGIGTDDDTRRVAFIEQALDSVRACIDDGIPVHSYMYWSLLDNFEWDSGYAKHFGLVEVDLKTFKRTPKPSAHYLGRRAKLNLI